MNQDQHQPNYPQRPPYNPRQQYQPQYEAQQQQVQHGALSHQTRQSRPEYDRRRYNNLPSQSRKNKVDIPLIIASSLAILFFILWITKPVNKQIIATDSQPINKQIIATDSQPTDVDAAKPIGQNDSDLKSLWDRFYQNEILSDEEFNKLRKDELQKFSDKLLSLGYINGKGKYTETTLLASFEFGDNLLMSLIGREDGINLDGLSVDLQLGHPHAFEIEEIMLKQIGYSGDSAALIQKIEKQALNSSSKSCDDEYDGIHYFYSYPSEGNPKISIQFIKDVK